MRRVLIASAFVTLSIVCPAAAVAGDVGYVNLSKAIRDTAEGKKAFAEIEAVARQHQAELDSAAASARAAADKCQALTGPARKTCDVGAQKAQGAAEQLGGAFNADVRKRQQAADQRVAARALRILPKIAATHRLLLIQPGDAALFVSPKADFTAELVKLYDAGAGKTDDEVAAELRDKNAELEAQVAALKKAAAAALPAPGKK